MKHVASHFTTLFILAKIGTDCTDACMTPPEKKLIVEGNDNEQIIRITK